MKKFLLWILIIVLLPISYFAYGLLSDHIIEFRFFSNPQNSQLVEENGIEFNRNVSSEPIGKPVVLFIANNLTKEESESLLFAQTALQKGSNGEYPVYPILDEDLSLVNILTGVSPNRGNYLSNPNISNLDSILLSSLDAGYKVAYFGNHLPSTDSESMPENESLQNPAETHEITIPASFVEPVKNIEELSSWMNDYSEQLKSYQFLIFNIPFISDPLNSTEREKEIELFNETMENISLSCGEESQYYFTSPISFSYNLVSLMPNFDLKSPFYAFGNHIKENTSSISTQLENLTSTISFSLGLSPSNENIATPIVQLFDLPEETLLEKYTSFVNGQMIGYISVLLDQGIDQESVAGFILHANDSINTIPSKDLSELTSRVDLLQAEFFSFMNNKDSSQKKKELLFFTILLALASILWLAFAPWNLRGYLYGIAFTIIFVIFNTFVFKNALTIPALSDVSVEWLFLKYSLPLICTSVVSGTITTLLGGFVFNVDIYSIIKDLNCQIGTFIFLVIVETSLLGIHFGYSFNGSIETFVSQLMFTRNETIIILAPVALLIMICESYIFYKILTKNNKRKILNETTPA
ncbi:MAG: hypothetical protein KAH01_04545 [Caldisericia bacterium]|nr:hypothetical protein [Caldisericia bacterium]